VTQPNGEHTLASIDRALEHVGQALAALGRGPKRGEEGVRVDGLEHELGELEARLRAFRDELATQGEGAE
jgi:hypothetical protein